MKKLIYVALILLAIDAFLYYNYENMEVKPRQETRYKQLRVKKALCKPTTTDPHVKNKYINVSYYGRVESTQDFYDQTFETKEEYNKELSTQRVFLDQASEFKIEEYPQTNTFRIIQTSQLDNYVSLYEIIEYLTQHECEYIEYY